ncbi:hypothetical protein PABG_11272 [Paracoccidioides brasiliensis Pb03]|nr:hypothetical protein PABG_11272 [Paracoccidioides brasiliensis Pb03]
MSLKHSYQESGLGKPREEAELGPLHAAKAWHLYAKTLISQALDLPAAEQKGQQLQTGECMMPSGGHLRDTGAYPSLIVPR